MCKKYAVYLRWGCTLSESVLQSAVGWLAADINIVFLSDEALCTQETWTFSYSSSQEHSAKQLASLSGPSLHHLHPYGVWNSFCWCPSLSRHATTLFTMFQKTLTLPWYPHHAVAVPPVAPHACPLSPCATHLLNRRPPACMWLWMVCQRPALLPPVNMLRTLSLRLGPAPEQAPTPLSLAPGEGPAPPCPPLSPAPLGGKVGRIRDKETRTDRQKEKTRIQSRETDGQTGDRRTDEQSREQKNHQ